jgi:hypothetical protein
LRKTSFFVLEVEWAIFAGFCNRMMQEWRKLALIVNWKAANASDQKPNALLKFWNPFFADYEYLVLVPDCPHLA